MNIALVAMAQQNASGAFQDNGSVILGHNASGCEKEDSARPSVNVQTEFTWSNTLQGIVLSAFYYGYFTTQAGTVFGMLSAGYLCDVPQLGWPSVFYIGATR
nr:hypothetical protein BaRGS_000895 [Batillaria attramentaria]